jgi:hypothetical protein
LPVKKIICGSNYNLAEVEIVKKEIKLKGDLINWIYAWGDNVSG